MIGDRYELGDVIGTGGMGEVRAARDIRLQRDVAVKLLHAALLDRPGMRTRIRSEARAAAGLSHPNVVAVFDAGVDDTEHPYIVMERLDGRTLADELAGGPMSVERARSMANQVLQALATAHAAGLVHRDVKPGNVLFAGEDTWKVADFGIAKWLDESGITRTGEVMGSPGYLAPERLEGIPASPSSDLYSVGVLLYEALTGRRLAAGDHSWVAAADRDGAVTPLVELRPDAGPALDQIVARAMSPDPSRRFASAEEMMKAIENSAQATVPIPQTTEEVATTARIEPVPSARARTPVHASARPPSERDPTLRSIVIAMAIGATALLILLVVAFAVVGGGADPPTAGATGAGVDLPAPLTEALDRLEGAIP